MKLAAAATAAMIAAPAVAVELSSTWQPNETRRYQYEETSNAGGVAVTLRSTFAERPRALRRDGGVDLDITVESLEICRGQPLRCDKPSLTAALRNFAAVSDHQGRLVAPRVPIVTLRDGRLALRSAAGAEPAVEIVPLGLLTLLALPEGAVTPKRAVASSRDGARFTLLALDHDRLQARITVDAQLRRRADVAAEFAVPGGALVEARGVVIDWQPMKRNALVVLQRRR